MAGHSKKFRSFHLLYMSLCVNTSWIRRLWWVPLIVLAMALRFYGLTFAAIWGDESSSLLFSDYSLKDLWFHTAYDVHPPLYFFLLRGWIELFGYEVFSIRSMSAILGVIIVGLGIWLTQLIANRRAAVLVGVFLALLPTAVRYSQEVRMYSLLGVWILGATLALIYWVHQPSRVRYLVAYALLMTAGFYTHYFTILCVLVHWSWLVLLRLRGTYRLRLISRPIWWWANIAIVVLYLPWVPNLLSLLHNVEQLKVGGDIGWAAPVNLFSVPAMIWQFLIRNEGKDLWRPVFFLLPALLLAIMGLVAWRDQGHYRFGWLLTLFFMLPLLLIYAVSFISPVFVERYLTIYAFGLPITLALAVDRLSTRFSLLGAFLFVLFVGLEVVGLRANFIGDKSDQFNVPVEFVNRNYQKDDRIVVSNMLWYLSYLYYDETDSQLQLFTPPTATGKSTRPNTYGFGTLLHQNGARIYLDRLSALPANTRRVWLIGSNSALDEFVPLPDGWRQLTQQNGGGARARLFVLCNAPILDHIEGCD